MRLIEMIATNLVALNVVGSVPKITLLLAIGLVVVGAMRKSSASMKHAILATLLFGCLLVPVVSSGVGEWQLSSRTSQVTSKNINSVNHAQRLPIKDLAKADSRKKVSEEAASRGVSGSANLNSDLDQVDSLTTASSSSQEQDAESPFPWIAMIWLAGAFLSLVPLLTSTIQKRRLIQHAQLLDDPKLSKLLQKQKSMLGVERSVQIFEVDCDILPLTWGVVNPVIMLPRTWKQWSKTRCEIVLLHELAHIKRLDLPVQILGRLCCAAYWFHPLVWITFRKLGAEREQACDDLVVHSGQQATDYATELLAVAEARCKRNRLQAGLSMADHSDLKSRIRCLLDVGRCHLPNSSQKTMALTTISISIALAIGSFGGFAESSRQEESTSSVVIDKEKLPEGAIMQFGTLNYQHPNSLLELALNVDQDQIVTFGNNSITAFNESNGDIVWNHPIAFSDHLKMSSQSYGFRPIARIPETNSFVACGQEAGQFCIVDGATGKSREVKIDQSKITIPAGAGLWRSVDVSMDGQLVSLGNDRTMLVCDIEGQIKYQVNNNPVEDIGALRDPTLAMPDRLAFGGEFSYARFSLDSEHLIMVNSEKPKTIQVLNADTGEAVREFKTKDRVVRMDVSRFGSHLVTSERDRSMRKYDLESGDRLWSLDLPAMPNGESYTSGVAVSPDGQLAAVCAPLGSDHRIRVVDMDDGKELAALEGHAWKPMSLTFSDDSKTLYSSGWDATIIRWDMDNFQRIPQSKGEVAFGIADINAHESQIAYTVLGGKVNIVDANSAAIVHTLDEPGCDRVRFSPEGTRLAIAGVADKEVYLSVVDCSSGERIHRWAWPVGADPHSSITSISFTNDASRVGVVNFRQSMVYVLDLETKEQSFRVRHPGGYGLSFDPSGKFLATAGWDASVKFWDANSGASDPRGALKLGGGGLAAGGADMRLYSVRFSPDGRHFGTVHMGARIQVRDRVDRELVSEDMGGSSVAGDVFAYSNNGLWMAVGTYGGEIRMYDALTCETILQKKAHTNYAESIAFGPKGRTLLTGGTEGVSYLWSLRPEQDVQKSPADLFEDLMGEDAPIAYQAFWAMVEQPVASLKVIEQRLVKGDVSANAEELKMLHPLAVLHALRELESTGEAATELLQTIATKYQGTWTGIQAERLGK